MYYDPRKIILFKLAAARNAAAIREQMRQLEEMGVLDYPEAVGVREALPIGALGLLGFGAGAALRRVGPISRSRLLSALSVIGMTGLGGYLGYLLGRKWGEAYIRSHPEMLAQARRYLDLVTQYRQALGLPAPEMPTRPADIIYAVEAYAPREVLERRERERLQKQMLQEKARMLREELTEAAIEGRSPRTVITL